MLNTSYQQYIHLSKYARWLPSEGRRETWLETVQRYAEAVIPVDIRANVEQAIYNLEVMPSMRAMWAAGPALERCNVTSYNCSYLQVDSPRAFDESLYISMCGTGVGFSVERQFICKLPDVPEEMHATDTTIAVHDSRIGWAKAFRELIAMLYAGHVPDWDVSKVRPAGSPLGTSGGRSSGPGPLVELFRFTVAVFRAATGRKLNSIECHDIMTKVASVVVVGGVRRSAMISLSNPSDDRMRDAKSGQWWTEHPQRALANNSAAYTERPDFGVFMGEWQALHRSKSGERGIYNRRAAKQKAEAIGRDVCEFGTNPCVTADTWVMTTDGPRQVRDLIGVPFTAVIHGEAFPCETGFFATDTKRVLKVETDRGYAITCTPDHLIQLADGEWKEAGSLLGDTIRLHEHRNVAWGPDSEKHFNLGWVLGVIVGDGGYNPEKYSAYARFWGPDAKQHADRVASIAREHLEPSGQFKGPTHNKHHQTWQVSCKALDRLCEGLIDPMTKEFTSAAEQQCSRFSEGMICGFFDTDGSPQGNRQKGRSIRLSQASRPKLAAVQRMLARLGILSTVYDRHEGGPRPLPDGKGGTREYETKPCYELVVARSSMEVFRDRIGLRDPAKASRLADLLAGGKRGPYRDKPEAKVMAISMVGEQEVYDCTVPGPHCFDANGIVAHNCAEISLRSNQFCNLSEVVIRPGDTMDTLAEKVRIATIIGTCQSALTKFRYLRPRWANNCKEERLLGVSLTGICDGPDLSVGDLQRLRQVARDTNVECADRLGIEHSKAVTCVKPSGTVSQLVDSSSGIHPRFAAHYIRRVREDGSGPIAQFLIDAGVPHEQDAMSPTNVVFSFPMSSPEGARTQADTGAEAMAMLWERYNSAWADHSVSATVQYSDDEFLGLGQWVWTHFDEITGLSFLPRTDHTYQQAPYEAIDGKTHAAMVEDMPDLDWAELARFEGGDTTQGQQTLACVGDNCEL